MGAVGAMNMALSSMEPLLNFMHNLPEAVATFTDHSVQGHIRSSKAAPWRLQPQTWPSHTPAQASHTSTRQ
eukprot:1390377-Alexandrium_andersonii.AAC.1